jgi:hypothetical protein
LKASRTNGLHLDCLGSSVERRRSQFFQRLRPPSRHEAHGNAHGIIVGLNGYWLTKKYVVTPFEQFSWDYEPSEQNPSAFVIARAKVPYTLEHLQGLPPAGDPWVPLNQPAPPGSE